MIVRWTCPNCGKTNPPTFPDCAWCEFRPEVENGPPIGPMYIPEGLFSPPVKAARGFGFYAARVGLIGAGLAILLLLYAAAR